MIKGMPVQTANADGAGGGRERIQHFSHPHPLLRFEKGKFRCSACKSAFRGRAYGCATCGYFLDQSCAELPARIHTPLHAFHGLLSLRAKEWNFTCVICETYVGRGCFSYWCNQCYNFSMCVKCTKGVTRTSTRNIKYEDHSHPLYLSKITNTAVLNTRCNGPGDYCMQSFSSTSENLSSTEPYMLWCWECEFRVHLLCALLPSFVKHECHIHPLVLADSLLEDDSGQYCCDVCETERDPHFRFYCCWRCKYFSHVKCVISEIAKTLKGELKGVKLKTPGQDTWEPLDRELVIDDDAEQGKSAMTLKDVINELSEEQKNAVGRHYKWDETSCTQKDSKDEEVEDTLGFSRFTEADFGSFFPQLMRRSYWDTKLELKSSDLELKIVKVKGYMIPCSLAAVLNTLLHEFGDFCGRSKATPGFKCFALYIVCKLVKQMRSTMVKDVTKNLLRDWCCHLEFAKKRALEVDFAHEELERLLRAFIGFQARRLEHEIPQVLEKKIAHMQQQLETLRECLSSPKSEFVKSCLNKASELEWKFAFEDLSKHKRSTNS